MISDKIEQLRSCGTSDEAIAGIIYQAACVKLPSEAIALFYVSPEARRRHHGGGPDYRSLLIEPAGFG